MQVFSKELLMAISKNKIIKIEANSSNTAFLLSNGDFYFCGSDSNYISNFTLYAQNVVDFTTAVGFWYIDNNGDLYGKGVNGNGQQGDGTTTRVNTFTKRASNVKQVVSRSGVTWYLTNSGDLYGCGFNGDYQQNNGTNSGNTTTFTKRASNVKEIVNGINTERVTWYIDNNNDLYGCGFGGAGQQGNGGTSDVTTFTKRASNVVKAVSSYQTTWYIDNNGDLYGCGWAYFGQQGSGNTTNVKTFTKRASNVKDVLASNRSTWYLTNSGDLYGCGGSATGQQGSGGTSNVTTFTKRASNVISFALDVYDDNGCTWYIDSNNDLYGCGYGYTGAQSNNSTSNVLTFTKRASNVSQVSSSYYTTFYIDNNGNLYGCGSNYAGQQGNGLTGSSNNVLTFENKMQYLT